MELIQTKAAYPLYSARMTAKFSDHNLVECNGKCNIYILGVVQQKCNKDGDSEQVIS